MKTSILTISILLFSLIALTGCFSSYPIQKESPCDKTTTQEKLDWINAALDDQIKPKTRELNAEGITYNKKSFRFEDVRYVRAKTKTSLTGRKYWIQIREFNGEMNEIYLRDFETMEKANNALMCLTDLQATHGRPKN